jgi:glutamate N-acetyltransferase / amino-acid N-acetyltransferase
MAIGDTSRFPLRSVPGVRLGTAAAGIRQTERDDVVVIELAEEAVCAAVFTRNAFCAAPVIVARQHLQSSPRWLLINSGNANAGTGSKGLQDAERSCRALAQAVHGDFKRILPFSTGVIGDALPVAKIEAVLPTTLNALSKSGWEQAATAIMTTDTRPKGASRELILGGHRVTITGIAKGAGMIHPNMATMLAFIATDASIEHDTLQQCLEQAVDQSFNCITVDGDTSTNDACVLMATGCSKASTIALQGRYFSEFQATLLELCKELAEAIIRDGEGATKLIRIHVEGAASEEEAHRVGKTIAHSPLVKTAFFAGDPNWGRILAAVGRSGIDRLDVSGVSIRLGDVCIVRNGEAAPDYDETAAQAVMAGDDITVRVLLGRGLEQQKILTCDLSHEYVRINAEYRT